MSQIVGGSLMIVGASLALLAGVGLVRLPSALARLHAAAKPASLGLALVAVGAGVAAQSWELAVTGSMVAVFQFLTAPISGHLLGRSLYAGREPALNREGGSGSDPRTATHSPTLGVAIALVWIFLWRDVTWGTVAAGVGLGFVVAWRAGPSARMTRRNPLAALSTLFRYVASLLRANVRMAYQVLAFSESRLKESVVLCDLETRQEGVAFFDANATSFSPGTLTLEITSTVPYRMLVHSLGQSETEVRSEVAELEASAARVFE